MLDEQALLKLARWRMPFGKYQGRLLADLPENYLLWFERNSFPDGELGQLLALALEIRRENLDHLLQPLKHRD